ncbi:hypothetical protein ACE6H2_007271 [Prunus campanulata]
MPSLCSAQVVVQVWKPRGERGRKRWSLLLSPKACVLKGRGSKTASVVNLKVVK